jgi:hypothetical protein
LCLAIWRLCLAVVQFVVPSRSLVWDAAWLNDIASHGYSLTRTSGSKANVVFFPLYPILVRIFHEATGISFVSAGLLISHVSTVVFVVVACHLLKRFLPARPVAGIVGILLFPTAFFLVVFYTEALFLALVVIALDRAASGRWMTASIAGALASATRPVGVLLVVALWVIGSEDGDRSVRRWWLAIVPAGLISYLAYLWLRFGDPFVWVARQQSWDREVGAASPVRFLRHVGHVLISPSIDIDWAVHLIDVVAIALLAALCFGLFRAGQKGLAIWSAMAILVPIGTGVLDSSARYALASFPAIAWGAATMARKYPRLAVGAASAMLAIELVLAAHFLSGGWVG